MTRDAARSSQRHHPVGFARGRRSSEIRLVKLIGGEFPRIRLASVSDLADVIHDSEAQIRDLARSSEQLYEPRAIPKAESPPAIVSASL